VKLFFLHVITYIVLPPCPFSGKVLFYNCYFYMRSCQK